MKIYAQANFDQIATAIGIEADQIAKHEKFVRAGGSLVPAKYPRRQCCVANALSPTQGPNGDLIETESSSATVAPSWSPRQPFVQLSR